MPNYDSDFDLLVQAAVNGDRCPQTRPHGPLHPAAIRTLIAENRIKSEVYRHNYRVVTILSGPHRGKTTAKAPDGAIPFRVNGLLVKRFRLQPSQ